MIMTNNGEEAGVFSFRKVFQYFYYASVALYSSLNWNLKKTTILNSKTEISL